MNRTLRWLLAGLISLACSFAATAQTASQSIANAEQFWAEGKLDEAQKELEAAASAKPESAEVLLRLAGFQLSRQMMTDCITNYKKVISLEPKNSKAWIGLGMAYLHISNPGLAKAALEEAVRVDPARKEKLQPVINKLSEKSA